MPTFDTSRMLRTVEHPERTKEIVEVLVGGFMVSPLWVYVEPNESRRRAVLMHINRMRILVWGARSEFWLGADGLVEGHMVCSKRPATSTEHRWCTLAIQILLFWLRFGTGVFRRTCAALARSSDVQRSAFGDGRDDWTIEAFVVRPEARGNGVGSSVLGAVLAQRVLCAPGRRVHLLCQDRARRLYLRHGFVDVDAPPYMLGNYHMPNHCMELRSG